ASRRSDGQRPLRSRGQARGRAAILAGGPHFRPGGFRRDRGGMRRGGRDKKEAPVTRASRFLPLLIGICAWLAFVLPALHPPVALYYRDTGLLYYPVKHYMAGRLARGELPFWDPWSEAGVSLLGQTTPGLFHP